MHIFKPAGGCKKKLVSDKSMLSSFDPANMLGSPGGHAV